MSQAEKITAKDPKTKLAFRRLSVLQLAEVLGNISEACRRSGMDRTSFYEWKKRFQERGLEGLRDQPPIVKNHPWTTKPEVVQKILECSKKHPSWGCVKLSDHLKIEGVSVSSPTVQDILIKNEMGSKYERLMKLEEENLKGKIELTHEQVTQIEKMNPAFRERLSQDTFYVGSIKGVGKIYLQSVVDTYGSYAFGFLHGTKQAECGVAILHNDVLPFYRKKQIEISAILTDNGREYCGTQGHPYELYLALSDIEHRTTKIRRPQTNGFVERFHRTVQEEFLKITFRKKLYTSIEGLQEDLDDWLHFYNYERPHRGYRNMGKRPIDTIKSLLLESSPFASGALESQRS